MTIANEILNGDLTSLTLMVQSGVVINEIDEYGYTPLIEACIVNETEKVQLLLAHGADPNFADSTGGTALQWAAENANLAIAKLLLDAGANPNAFAFSGQPVITMPLLREQHEFKFLLYQYGAELPFAQDYINTKLLGHRFQLQGQVDLVSTEGKFVSVDLEGFYLEFSLALISNSLSRYRNNFAARHMRDYFEDLAKVIDGLKSAVELIKLQQYQIDIEEHQREIEFWLDSDLQIIPVNYQGHAISLVQHNGYLIKCDRRQNNPFADNLPIYRIKRLRAWNTELISTLIYEKKSADFIDHGLVELLDLEQVSHLMIGRQISGNCSWANIEAAIPAALLLLSDEFQQQPAAVIDASHPALYFFRQWREWDKDHALHQCIESFYEANQQRRASKASLLAAVLFQRCGAEIEADRQRAKQIFQVLHTSGYEYIIDSYIETYRFQKVSQAGKNFQRLLEAYRDDLL